MLRGAGAAFMAGAYVFPGGKVDPWDADPDGSLTDGSDLDDLHLRMAAVREVFEEAGVLLGTRAGEPLPTDFLDDEAARFYRHNGFLGSPIDPLVLMLPLDTARRALE